MRSKSICVILLATIVFLAAPLVSAGQGLTVVVHRTNTTTDLKLSRLVAILSLTVPRWPDNSKVVIAAWDERNPLRQIIYGKILGTTPLDLRKQLARAEFAGEEPVIIRMLNSDLMACKFVANVPGAITVIGADSRSMPECIDLHVLRINGKLPGEEGYPLP